MFTPKRTKMPLKPCKDIKLDLSGVNYSQKDLEDAFCLEFDKSHDIGGSHKDLLIKLIDFFLRPC